jgi:hypothetical protein
MPADEVAVQRVELHRVLAEGRRQAGACLDVVADLDQQPGHARVVAAARHDVEGLQQRHACLEHGCELAREDRDFLALDRVAAGAAAFAHLGHHDALAPQRGVDHGFTAGTHFPAHGLAVTVAAFPLVDEVLDLSCRCRTGCGHVAVPSKG